MNYSLNGKEIILNSLPYPELNELSNKSRTLLRKASKTLTHLSSKDINHDELKKSTNKLITDGYIKEFEHKLSNYMGHELVNKK